MGTKTLLERLELFPITTEIKRSDSFSSLTIAGCNLQSLAAEYGTPLYLYDRATLDAAVKTYLEALARFYAGPSGLTYAAKAYLCKAIAQWTQVHDLWVDCTGAGELHVAASAGLPRAHILVHGVNKAPADLQAAITLAGTLVFDNLGELTQIVAIHKTCPDPFPLLWFRLRPGVATGIHKYTQTGQDNSKFGLGVEEARRAVEICQENDLPLTGLHFHQGSHFRDPAPLGPAIDIALDLILSLYQTTGWLPQTLCPGGGWGVAYHENDLPQPPVDAYVNFVASRVAQGCESRGLPLPFLRLEPGRSLVARAGVALYHVGAVKKTPDRRWLLIDGGLADNPRPAIYRSRYSALPVVAPERKEAGLTWLGGPFCESGDILIEDLAMPEILPGELIAIPVSGAYQLSMASNYNGARKPAVLLLQDGSVSLIQKRETLDDLIRRDLPLPDPTYS
jgi:diaminopimelate decarboxylase